MSSKKSLHSDVQKLFCCEVDLKFKMQMAFLKKVGLLVPQALGTCISVCGMRETDSPWDYFWFICSITSFDSESIVHCLPVNDISLIYL